MSKIVIIEGIDRVGKTTLSSNFFKERFMKFEDTMDFVSTEAKRINNEKISSTINALNAFKYSNAKIVFDRFYLSEYVYGFLNRGYNTYIECKDFDNRLTKLKATKILVVPKDEEELKRCSEEHGQDLSKHNEMFVSYCSNSDWFIVKNDKIENLLEMLKRIKII